MISSFACRACLLATALVAIAPAAQAKRPIFSNFKKHFSFKETSPTPWCISGDSTPDCGPSVTRWVAVAFTPQTTTTLGEFYVAIQNIDAPNSVLIDLVPDFDGTPANTTPLEEWTISPLPANQATFQAEQVVSVLHPALQAGQQYWIVAKPVDGTSGSLDTWYWGAKPKGLALDGLNNGLSWLAIKSKQTPALAVYGQ
jgi:hypothetical protein